MKITTRKTLMGGAVAAALGIAIAPAVSVAHGGEGYRFERSHHHHWGGGRGARMLERFDTNNDGALTQSEIDTAREQRRARFDTNADGALTLEEYEAMWLDVRRERMVDGFQTLDADGDGMITVEEFQRPARHMVSGLDRNGDGQITRDDMRRRGKHAKFYRRIRVDGGRCHGDE